MREEEKEEQNVLVARHSAPIGVFTVALRADASRWTAELAGGERVWEGVGGGKGECLGERCVCEGEEEEGDEGFGKHCLLVGM